MVTDILSVPVSLWRVIWKQKPDYHPELACPDGYRWFREALVEGIPNAAFKLKHIYISTSPLKTNVAGPSSHTSVNELSECFVNFTFKFPPNVLMLQ